MAVLRGSRGGFVLLLRPDGVISVFPFASATGCCSGLVRRRVFLTGLLFRFGVVVAALPAGRSAIDLTGPPFLAGDRCGGGLEIFVVAVVFLAVPPEVFVAGEAGFAVDRFVRDLAGTFLMILLSSAHAGSHHSMNGVAEKRPTKAAPKAICCRSG
jgi:hypothetical protein